MMLVSDAPHWGHVAAVNAATMPNSTMPRMN
jgi:hypothetical protein